jgi:hypothetical protein
MSGWRERLNEIDKRTNVIAAQVTALAIVVQRLASSIEDLRREHVRTCSRLADKLIELAMVNRGEAAAAVAHRRAEPVEPVDSLWDGNPETDWPPPGTTRLDIP